MQSIDSIRNTLAETTDRKERLPLLLEFSKEIVRFSPGYALELAKEALQIASALDDQPAVALALLRLASVHYGLADYPASLSYLHRALPIFESLEDDAGRVSALHIIGLVYSTTGEHSKALEILMETQNLCEKTDQKELPNILNAIGVTYKERRDFDRALEYYHKSLQLQEERQDKLGISICLNNIGVVYRNLKEYETALPYYLEALRLRWELGDTSGKAKTLANIGNLYADLGRTDEAFEHFQQALEHFYSVEDKRGMSDVLQFLGTYYSNRQQYTESLEHLHRSLHLAEELEAKSRLVEIHRKLADVHKMTGNFEQACRHLEEYDIVKENVFNERSSREIHAITESFNRERMERDNEIVRLKNIELAQAFEHLEQLNQYLIELNLEKSEFLGIAAHDMKNPLSNIRTISNLLHQEAGTLTPDEIRELSGDIRHLSERMFDLITSLLSVHALENGGLKLTFSLLDMSALMMRVADLWRERALHKDITIYYESDPGIMCYADETFTYQILENLLSNAVKYSPSGKHIYVRLRRQIPDSARKDAPMNSFVRVEIQDEGQGISKEDMPLLFGKFVRLSARPTGGEHSTGLGLSIVKKLTEAMSGKVWCESAPGTGATFILELPESAASCDFVV